MCLLNDMSFGRDDKSSLGLFFDLTRQEFDSSCECLFVSGKNDEFGPKFDIFCENFQKTLI